MIVAACATFLGLVATYCAAALGGALLSGPSAAISGPPEIRIGLLAGPIHNDFLLPLDDQTRASFGFLSQGNLPLQHRQAKWLLIGWGARDFYTSVGSYSDVTLRASLKGIFGDASVMRADVFGPIDEWDEIATLTLSRAQYRALLAAISDSFTKEAEVIRASTAAQPGAFFTARGRFHLGHTCNQWVGEMLRQAGLRFGRWTPIPASIRLSLWRFNHQSG